MTNKEQSLSNPSINSFVLFAVSSIFIFAIFYIASTILPLYIVELGGTEFDIGLQTILFYLTSIICRFYFGPLSDRRGRKIPLVIGAFVFSTSSLLFWLCKDVNLLLIARIYQAIGLAAFFSNAATFAADFAPPSRVGLFMGIYRVLFTVGLLIGPIVGMEVVNHYDYDRLFILCFAVGLLAMLLILLIKAPKEIRGNDINIIKVFRELMSYKKLHTIFFGYAIITGGYGIVVTYVVLYLAGFGHYGNPGIYFTYFCLAGIIASLTAGYFSDRIGRQNIVWPSVILLGVGIMVLSTTATLPAALIISSVTAGIGFSAGVAVFMAWLIDETEEEIKGTVLAFQESIFDLSFGLSSFIFGIIAGWILMPQSFMLVGIIVFVIGGVFLLRTRGWQRVKVK